MSIMMTRICGSDTKYPTCLIPSLFHRRDPSTISRSYGAGAEGAERSLFSLAVETRLPRLKAKPMAGRGRKAKKMALCFPSGA